MPMERRTVVPNHFKRVPDLQGIGTAPRSRASGKMERYLPTDPRMEPDACEHTQVRDISVASGIVRCLDCGAVLDVTKYWQPIPDEPLLSDSDLVGFRRDHNDIWFDKTYKMTPGLPDDPVQDARIANDLKDKKVEKL